MQIHYTDLKKKRVINLLDGRELGTVTDIIFDFPEGKVIAFVCGDKRKIFKTDEYLVNLCCVNKIGDDTVLVSLKSAE